MYASQGRNHWKMLTATSAPLGLDRVKVSENSGRPSGYIPASSGNKHFSQNLFIVRADKNWAQF